MGNKTTALVVVLIIGVLYFGFSWWFARQELAQTETEMTELYRFLEDSEVELTGTQRELTTAQSELNSAHGDLSSLSAELESTRSDLNTTTLELEDTQAMLAAIESDRFNLHNPTFREALDFLEDDRTDRHEYIEDEYVCSHFAADVNNNAEDEGIRCAMVDVRFPDSAHAVIAFETVDEGLVYFDPITDERVRPVIGKNYWKCIEPKPGYKYEKPSFDDTIVDIVIIW